MADDNDGITTRPASLITFGDAAIANGRHLAAEALPHLRGSHPDDTGGTMPQVAQGIRAPAGFAEWRALGDISVDNVRMLAIFIGESIDGLDTTGRIATASGRDYRSSDKDSRDRLDHVEESLLAGQAGSSEFAHLGSRPNTVDLPAMWPEPEYPVLDYHEQRTDWAALDLDTIGELILGADAGLPAELADRWREVRRDLRAAHRTLAADVPDLSWGGTAGRFFAAHVERSLSTMDAWVDAMPRREATLRAAAKALRAEQVKLRHIIDTLATDLTEPQAQRAKATDATAIAALDRKIRGLTTDATNAARDLGRRLGEKLVDAGPWHPPGRFRGFLGSPDPAGQRVPPQHTTAPPVVPTPPGPPDLPDVPDPPAPPTPPAPPPIPDPPAPPVLPGVAPVVTTGAGAGGVLAGRPVPSGLRAPGALGANPNTPGGKPTAAPRGLGAFGGLIAGRGGALARRRSAKAPDTVLGPGTELAGQDGLLRGRLEATPQRTQDDAAPASGFVPPLATGAALGGRMGPGAVRGTPQSTQARTGTPGEIAAGRRAAAARDDQQRRRTVADTPDTGEPQAEQAAEAPDVHTVDVRAR
ncbi:hypothetical protein F4553_000937 [Allocatelliglobosispora scoriae]|uniref:Uncharacterized protein n=1 Tax=Allocatelliglobosispora scoriae TaxID=643052 RepID=A0A841BJP8_9ACTN|nr:hypothetical protein [Allocatelliglobosispora scoriae]MBB5867558.1 hypothetical protein [Allocatelliglobosispora scoriae]